MSKVTVKYDGECRELSLEELYYIVENDMVKQSHYKFSFLVHVYLCVLFGFYISSTRFDTLSELFLLAFICYIYPQWVLEVIRVDEEYRKASNRLNEIGESLLTSPLS